MDRFDPVGDIDPTFWDRVMAINLRAPAMITQRAVKAWLAADKKGAIVNIASIAGVRGFAGGTYAFAKPSRFFCGHIDGDMVEAN